MTRTSHTPPDQPVHWKHRATRCAVIGCERRRKQGWSTCSLMAHVGLGKHLQGAGKIEPIPAPKENA